MVKNNDEVKNVHQYDNNYDDEYVEFRVNNDTEIPLSQQDEYDPVDSFPVSVLIDTIKLEWILKRYTVNNNNTDDIKWYTVVNDNMVYIKLEWILKKYQVDNDKSNDTMISQMLCLSICRAATVILGMEIRSAWRGVVNTNNCGNNIVHQKQNEWKHTSCQVLLF